MPTSTERTPDDALRELEATTGELARLPKLHERRVELYRELRAATPPVTYSRIAKSAGITTEGVVKALRKHSHQGKQKPVESATGT